jgi:hypothetical protein
MPPILLEKYMAAAGNVDRQVDLEAAPSLEEGLSATVEDFKNKITACGVKVVAHGEELRGTLDGDWEIFPMVALENVLLHGPQPFASVKRILERLDIKTTFGFRDSKLCRPTVGGITLDRIGDDFPSLASGIPRGSGSCGAEPVPDVQP